MPPLTARQQELYDWIVQSFKANQRMPSYREMQQEMGYTSPAPVQSLLESLKAKGRIDWDSTARSLRLTGYRVELVAIDQEAA